MTYLPLDGKNLNNRKVKIIRKAGLINAIHRGYRLFPVRIIPIIINERMTVVERMTVKRFS
jgi:hypothetical protein